MCGQRQLMSVFLLYPVASQDSMWVIRPSSRCAFSCWHPKSFYLFIFKVFFEIKLLRWKHWSLLGLYQAVLDLQTLHIASQNRITQLPWRRALPCFLPPHFLLRCSILQNTKRKKKHGDFVSTYLVRLNMYSWSMSKFKIFSFEQCLLTLELYVYN